MAERYRNTTRFSYDDYKQKVKKRENKDVTIFISVFIIGLLIILGFVKILSPNVDVGIAGKDDEFTNFEDSTYSSSIDSRLKKLQSDDFGSGDDMFSPEYDEKVVLPKQIRKTVGEMQAAQQELQQEVVYLKEEKEAKKNTKQEAPQPKPQEQQAQATTTAPIPTNINAKVVVGYYATDQQAEVAKSIIQEAGLGITPIIKNMGSYYTLQVGAYNSQEKAQQAANNLLKSNFPARVIVE